MVIEQKLHYEGDKGTGELQTIFDGGAAISIIRTDKVRDLATILNMPRPLEIKLGDGVSTIIFDKVAHLEFYLNGLRLSDEFYVSDNLSDEVIFGAPTLQKWHIKLDYAHGEIITDPKVARMRL